MAKPQHKETEADIETNMLGLALKIPFYWTFRKWGTPRLHPFSIVVSVSFRCNSRCKTCNVWKKPNDDMSVEEWRKAFHSIGRTPIYVTFTGGEPFLRKDFPEMVEAAYDEMQPKVITIPTNGILSRRIVEYTDRICSYARDAEIGINLSLDGVGKEHDEIRGVPGNWDQAMKTWKGLKELQKKHSNLVLSIHTVISKFNIHRFPEIYRELQNLEPDSYITEMAEQRVELDTVGLDITPEPEDYARVADFLSQEAKKAPARGIARVTQSFRAEYYQIAKEYLFRHEQIIPCYAGWASAHIAPNGDVWTCCIRAESIGNLREHDYDFDAVWNSPDAERLRRSIKNRECACPMANAHYPNMLLHPPTVFKVAKDLIARR